MVPQASVTHRLSRLLPRWALAWPALTWWVVFFILPIAWMLFYSFGAKPPQDVQAAVVFDHISFANYGGALSDLFRRVYSITLSTAAIGTALCLLVGFPVAYTIAVFVPARLRGLLVFLLILPYWTSFLLRTLAWRIVLAPQGGLSHTLMKLGIIDRPLLILDTNLAVQLGIVYNFLPIMILPIFVSLEKMDASLLQASNDLGAGPWRSFFQVTIPLAMPGIAGGMMMTFILSASDYVVPTILGGTKGLLVGNLIATQILSAQNLPLGAAMSVVLILMLAGTIALVALGGILSMRIINLIRGPAI